MSVDWRGRAQTITPRVRNFIDGKWQTEPGGELLKKFSPRDGQLLCEFGAGQLEEVDRAVNSARLAFDDGRWSRLPAQKRKEVLERLASLIENSREELALLECLDVGKPISEALRFDVPAAAARIRYNAEAADKLHGRVFAADQASLSYQLRRPMGVVAGIVGWNFPLVLAAVKLGPALAAGNCLVLKPSELTSFSTGRLAELAIEAGIPEGVFNVVHGGGAIGAALAHHPEVDLLSFTGSTLTGKKLLIAAGESNMKRLILECGGKAPNIVFDDGLNLDAVADGIVGRAFWNQGEVCTASSRLLIHERVKDQLLSLLAQKTEMLAMGDPLDADTQFGALVSRAHKEKIQAFIESGKRAGARVIYQGSAPAPFEGGFYMNPLIFDRVDPRSKIAQEEIFGPVLSAMTFRDEEEAIRLANGTVYGLSAIVWTKDPGRAHRLAYRLNAGWVTVNTSETPTGGAGEGVLSIAGQKQSGLGSEGGIDGLAAYTRDTAVQFFG